MSIKFRLIISYMAMLVVPLILSVITGSLIIGFNLHHISGGNLLNANPERQLVQQGSRIFSDIKLTAGNEPDKLQDINYLNELDKKLIGINTAMVVRKRETLLYSSELLNGLDITKELPGFGTRNEEYWGPITIDNQMYLIKQHDFYFSDQEQGSVFLLTDVGPFGRLARKIALSIIIAVLLILFFTNGLLTYLVSRSIVKPLEYLRNAAQQIKEGNLNFQIKFDNKDEISKLAEALEEMRHQLKKSLDQKLQYENNRKELISSISHDLKTPVTAIKGYVEGIMDGVADSPEKLDRYIKTIYSKANDLDHLIDELFLYSKLDLKKLPFHFEKVDIVKYLQDCVDEMQFDMQKHHIAVESFIEAGHPVTVLADRERLKRVITNIFQNSAKYMDKPTGKISVLLKTYPDTVTVKIEDNGQGISQQELTLIFEQFYRVDPSRNLATGGSGLGLAIAKRIIEEHGGKIWAQSIEGQGTTIFFTLKRV